MASYLITGCSRGLGLELATQLAALPSTQVTTIFATSRAGSSALESLVEQSKGKVVFVQLDATNQQSIKNAAVEVDTKLGKSGLDVLINNVGISKVIFDGIANMNNLEEHFTGNVMSAQWVTSAFIPLLEKGHSKKVVNISTTVGSLSLAPKYAQVPSFAYKISKAALNMLTVQYAFQYADKGFTIFAVSPGWLQTDLGNEFAKADLPVEVGAKATLDKILAAGREDNGKFMNIWVEGWDKANGPNCYDGEDVSW